MKQEFKHNPVFEHGYEYDDLGNVCGEWGQEVCSECGCRTDMMNSPINCTIQGEHEEQ